MVNDDKHTSMIVRRWKVSHEINAQMRPWMVWNCQRNQLGVLVMAQTQDPLMYREIS